MRFLDVGGKKIVKSKQYVTKTFVIDDGEELEKSFSGETYIVAGNCDFTRQYPKDRLLEFREEYYKKTGYDKNLSKITFQTKKHN